MHMDEHGYVWHLTLHRLCALVLTAAGADNCRERSLIVGVLRVQKNTARPPGPKFPGGPWESPLASPTNDDMMNENVGHA